MHDNLSLQKTNCFQNDQSGIFNTINRLNSPQNIPHKKEECILGRGAEVLAVHCDLKQVQEQTLFKNNF